LCNKESQTTTLGCLERRLKSASRRGDFHHKALGIRSGVGDLEKPDARPGNLSWGVGGGNVTYYSTVPPRSAELRPIPRRGRRAHERGRG